MNANRIAGIAVIALSLTAGAQAQTNSWVAGNGSWSTASNWSTTNRPSINDTIDFITNAANKTVTINAATSGSFSNSMSISNLWIWGPQDSTNTLLLSNAGTNVPLMVASNFFLGNRAGFGFDNNVGGVVIVTNSVIQLNGGTGSFEVGGTLTIRSDGVIVGPAPDIGSGLLASPGAVWVAGGKLIATNGTMSISGSSGSAGVNTDGQLTLSNGTVQAADLIVGNGVFTGSFARGTLTVAGGKMTLSGGIIVSLNRNSAGTIFVTGGELTMTNGDIALASRTFGLMSVSNGVVQARGMSIATGLGSGGTLTIAGGTVNLSSNITMAAINNGGKATMWVTGGQLIVTNEAPCGVIKVGVGGALQGATARVIVSNGTVTAREIFVGSQTFPGDGSVGTLTVAGGTVSILQGTNGLVIGTGSGSTGLVEVTGGQLLFGSSPLVLGNSGVGVMTVSNGAATVKHVTIGAGTNSLGALTLQTGGTMNVSSNLIAGAGAGSTATVSIVGGQLIVTNGVFGVGNNSTVTSGSGVGRVTVSNGTLLASAILLGSSVGGRGDLFLANGGTISCPGGTNGLIVINSLGFGQGGGNVTCGNTLECGTVAPADYNITDGQACFEDAYVGYTDVGTMTMSSGTVTVNSRLIVGHWGSPVTTGIVWITGGQLTVTNNYCIIGNSGVGQLTMSNGVATVALVFVANSGNPGTLTMAGGTMTMLSGLTIGDCGSVITGIVMVTSGNVFVTNAAHNATLNVRSGTLTMSGGFMKVDKLVMTNACGRFFHTGGTLQYSQLVLDPSLSAVSDGIPNSWKQQYGLDPFDPNLANEDPDGDGLSNLREYQLGTDPNDASSPYRITAIAREGNNIRVTWTTVGGKVNVVQVSPGLANGSYAKDFSDLSPELTILGSTVTSTNYLDLNGAISSPARYYRIRVLP